MTIGKFNIEDYDVTISNVTETRQRIIYYDLDNIFISADQISI